MSRAERRKLPPPPRALRVVREAVSDLYYNSWRFLGANMLVGLVLLVVVLAAVGSAWLLVLLPLASVPAAGTMRMATCLVRDGHVDFGDFVDVLRRPAAALVLGYLQGFVILVLVVDFWIGSTVGEFFGMVLTVSAAYGLLILWAYVAVAWTLLLDPERDLEPVPARLRLAGVVVIAHPIRVGGYLLAAGFLLGLSALAIAPFLTFTLALTWLAIARFVLPVADRIEGRATLAVEED